MAEAFSDGLGTFRRFADTGHAHTVLETEVGRAATEGRRVHWVNVVLSNVKRALDGAYHSVKQHRYARRHLAETARHSNRRFRLRDLVPRLTRAMTLCKPYPELMLHLACNFLH